jgi:ribonuclease HI
VNIPSICGYLASAGPSDIHKKLLSPYRAELSGLVATLYFIHRACLLTNTTSGSATIYCDCNKALRNILKPNYNGITDYLVPDSDLIQEAKYILKQLRIQIKLTWVKGHTSQASQNIEHKLNKWAHDLAYNYLKHPHQQFMPSAKVVAPPTEMVQLEYESSMITSNLGYVIKQEFHTESLITTICREAKWNRSIFDKVDWESFGLAFRSLPRGKQISYSKIANGIINVNTQNSRFYGTSAACPCCQLHQETITHLLTCENEASASHREKAKTILFQQLAKIRTPPRLCQILRQGLDQWEASTKDTGITMRASTSGSVHPVDIALTQAYRSQSYEIGWEHLFRGRISSHWSKAYGMSQTNKQLNQVAWASKLIIYLLEFTDSLWKFRNGVIHGHNLAETHKKRLEGLKQKISSAFSHYRDDPFIISRHQSSLFNKPFEEIIQMDLDYLQSWLRTFDEAVLTQQDFRRRQAERARSFFIPRSHQQNPTLASPVPQQPFDITDDSPPDYDDGSTDPSYKPRSSASSTLEPQWSYDSDDFLRGLSVSEEEISSLEDYWVSEDESSGDSVFESVFS